jgi:CBS domain-containing protein
MEISDTADVSVRVVMTSDVLGIVPAAPLEVALRMMVECGVRHLPVFDGDRCVGVLHESDVLWRLWSTAGSLPPLAGGVARRPAPCVDVSDSARKVTQLMSEAATDAVLVLQDGHVIGIVTSTNVVRLLADA